MTTEVFNHIKSNKETAEFIANVLGPSICKEHVCPTCPLSLPKRIETNDIKTGCACVFFRAIYVKE